MRREGSRELTAALHTHGHAGRDSHCGGHTALRSHRLQTGWKSVVCGPHTAFRHRPVALLPAAYIMLGPSSSASSSTTTAPPSTPPRPARSPSSASPPTASFSPDCNFPDGNGAILFIVHRRPHEFVTTFSPSCRLSSRPPGRTRSPGLVSRQRPAQPGDDTPPYSTAVR